MISTYVSLTVTTIALSFVRYIIYRYFSVSVVCLLILIIVTFEKQKFSILMTFKLLCFIHLHFSVMFKKYLPNPRSKRFSYMFLSREFAVSGYLVKLVKFCRNRAYITFKKYGYPIYWKHCILIIACPNMGKLISGFSIIFSWSIIWLCANAIPSNTGPRIIHCSHPQSVFITLYIWLCP